MSEPLSIAAIIVNYGTAELSIAAIESILARDHGGRIVEVHLVDNASPGADAKIFHAVHAERDWGDKVVLHLEADNHGFGRGNNVALRAVAEQAHPPAYVFLLNPDARLDGEALGELADFLDGRPEIGMVGCGITRPDGSPVSAAFRFPSIASEFASAVQFGPISDLFRKSQVALAADIGTQKVDWVSGAALLVRTEAVRQINFFDPDFFLYFEETDLMSRLSEQGWEIWHLPHARVEHVAGASTGMQAGRHKNRAQPGYWYDSWRLYFVKTRGPTYARFAALARLTGWGMNIFLRALQGRRSDGPDQFLRDFGARVLRPLFIGDPYEARPDGKTVVRYHPGHRK